METPQSEAAVSVEQQEKKKRSPWLIVIIILLLLMMCCCVMGAILCRGGAMLPGFLENYIRDIPGLENVDQIWDLVDDVINDPDFDPNDFFPDDFEIPDLDESDEMPEPVSGSGSCPDMASEYVLIVNHTWDFAPNRDTVSMKIDGWTESGFECPVTIHGSNVTMAPCAVLVYNEGFVQTDEGPCSVTAFGYTEITLDEPRCDSGVVTARIIDVIDPDMDSGGEMVCPGMTQEYFPFYPFSNTAVQFRLQPGGDVQSEIADPDTSNQYKYQKEWRLVPR